MASVSLKIEKENYYEKNVIENIENRNSFSYFDVDKNKIDIAVFDDGITLKKHTKGYEMYLCLRQMQYCQITSKEGSIKLDANVVAFIRNNDNIVVHYLIEDEERIIEIKY